MVRPSSPTTPTRVVTFLFSLEIEKTMYAEVASCGTCRVIEMITQRTVPPMRISVLTLRSCDGASSRRSQSTHPRWVGSASVNTALIGYLLDPSYWPPQMRPCGTARGRDSPLRSAPDTVG